jgi:hypothetical protein
MATEGAAVQGQPRGCRSPHPHSQHTAELLIRIARHCTLTNSIHGFNLPSSWRTLAELACFPPVTVQGLWEMLRGSDGPLQRHSPVLSVARPSAPWISTLRSETSQY